MWEEGVVSMGIEGRWGDCRGTGWGDVIVVGVVIIIIIVVVVWWNGQCFVKWGLW